MSMNELKCSSLPPVVCMRAWAHVLLGYLCLFEYSGVQFILFFCFAFLRLVYHMLPVSLFCPLWLPLRYSLTFISKGRGFDWLYFYHFPVLSFILWLCHFKLHVTIPLVGSTGITVYTWQYYFYVVIQGPSWPW